jgi:hypothetical protein
VPEPDGGSAGGGPVGGGARDGGVGGPSGDVRGESTTKPPPGFGGRGDAAGTSIWVGLALMLLAGLAGFATPALRDRLRGPGRTSRAS